MEIVLQNFTRKLIKRVFVYEEYLCIEINLCNYYIMFKKLFKSKLKFFEIILNGLYSILQVLQSSIKLQE